MEIYLIRHTTPILSAGLIYGRLEVPLSDTFSQELENIKRKLPEKFDVVYSSPSLRCTELAFHITPDFQTDTRLTELNFGDWEGKTWDTVDQSVLQFWMDDFVNVMVPGGESLTQMYDRVTEFLNSLNQQNYGKTAIVTHAGVIRLILSIIRKAELHDLFEIKVGYGDVIVANLTRNIP